MFSWRKTKQSRGDELAPEIAQSLHTMEDDLKGVSAPENSEFLPPEPPVSFAPDPIKGVPFFSAKETVQEKKDILPPNRSGGRSPFLASSGSDLPLTLPKLSPSLTQAAPQESIHHRDTLGPPGPEVNVKGAPQDQLKFTHKKLWAGLIFALTLLMIGGGVYYYFFVSRPSEEGGDSSTPPSSTTPPEAPTDLPSSTSSTSLSATQPNYLSLNIETVTAEGLRAELLSKAGEVKAGNLTGPVEFLVRDQNYNPLAFSRFSYLAKLGFSEALLAEINEDFSLYVFVDAGRPRFGLMLSIKNPTVFGAELKKSEKSLAQAITPLFYDTTTAPKTGLTFRSGSYNGQSTRYANVDPTIGLSVDYAIRGSAWMIGTSMNTLRAILDKEVAPPTPTSAETP